MILAWLIRYWPIVAGIVALLVVTAVVFSCSGDNESAQVQQTTRSAEAIASAAADAVSTLEDRTAKEQSIDTAVSTATQEIQNAQDADAVRNAVASALCGRPAYRNDPACRVR